MAKDWLEYMAGNPAAREAPVVLPDEPAKETPRENTARDPKTPPYGADAPVGTAQVRKANETLTRWRSAKAGIDRAVVEREHWYRLHRDTSDDPERADSGWLFNSLANKHADFMDNFPEPNVLPRARDDEQAAKDLTSVLPVVLEQCGYEQVYSDAGWYKLKHGTSFKLVVWDPEKLNGLGDIDIRLLDMLNVFWEPGIEDLQASRDLFITETVNADEVHERWPFVPAQAGNVAQTVRYQYDQTVDEGQKRELVHWYYKRGGRLHYCQYIGDTVIWASENEPDYAGRGYYDHGQYPVVEDVLFPIAGAPIGFGMIDVMMGTQKAIDTLDRSVVRSADIASRIRYFIKANGSINEREFADLEQDFVHAQGDVGEDSLRQITHTPLPEVYVAILNNKIGELKEVSGNRDYSQGATTSGVTAASAIAALQEAGSKLSRDMLKSAYRAFVRECYLCIELIRQFYDAPRQFRITGGDGGEMQFTTFSNAALRPQPQGPDFGVEFGDRVPVFDVTVVPAKKSTYSRLSQNELGKELYGLGLFNPQLADQSLALLDMLDFDGKERVTARIQQNGTLYDRLMQAQQQMQQMGMVIDGLTAQLADLTGSDPTAIAANMQANLQRTGHQPMPNRGEEKKTTTDTIGGVVQGDSLAAQARRRAQQSTDPAGVKG